MSLPRWLRKMYFLSIRKRIKAFSLIPSSFAVSRKLVSVFREISSSKYSAFGYMMVF
nr:MAG TPA: hypothetical protein [Caudoviricetes sp.]